MGEFEVGDRVAGYELLELVGEGRTGRVYQALQPRLERIVAVKIIRPELIADEPSREWFRRELRLAAAADHPGIVPVYEVDDEDGSLFVAMRWVDGPDLGRLLAERRRLDPAQAVRILGRVAAALEAAHGSGLFHRDLKPSNILLEGERVYLTDLGLAPVAGPMHEGRPSSLIGSVEYAAPELLDDSPPDSRTDVYALGCVLYEMLVGSVPFPPESLAISPADAGAHHPVPPSELRSGLPAAIDPVLRRALAADPAERYGTPTRFVEAVEAALAGSGVSSSPGRRVTRRWAAIIGATLVAVALVVVAAPVVFTGGGSDRTATAPRKTAAPVGGRVLPAAATLDPCGKTFSGPPRECRSKSGGVEVLVDPGTTMKLATLNLVVHRVREATSLSDPGGAKFSAPAGVRFVVIDATITNVTGETREFEPDNLSVSGRETAFWLVDRRGKIAPYHGHRGEDYSVQYDPVLGALQTPLAEVELLPHVPYSGQLVFHYPAKTLDADRRAILEVHELGRGFRYAKSFGGVRLHL